MTTGHAAAVAATVPVPCSQGEDFHDSLERGGFSDIAGYITIMNSIDITAMLLLMLMKMGVTTSTLSVDGYSWARCSARP